MKLNPGQLEVFVVVVECGSIRAAARRLGLTQPAVTYVVRELERDAPSLVPTYEAARKAGNAPKCG